MKHAALSLSFDFPDFCVLLRRCLAALWLLPHLGATAQQPLPRATPESQGVPSDELLDFIATLDERMEGMHSVMVVRHGIVVAEGWWAPYAAERNHVLYSLSKSFTSTAVGLAAAEGRLSIDDEVTKFFPEDAPPAPERILGAMRVRDLLAMSTGHQSEPPTAADKVSAKSFLAHPVPHKPGTHFLYNTAATFLLSAIVQKQTGQTVLDFLRPRLFEPLGIANPVWDANYQGISLGGYGLRVRTEDIAKFGQLYLQKGAWQGKQLLPADWVALATSRQVSNGSNPASDWEQGYGFQFWRCRHGAYRGDGAFGQYCVVMPEQDAVLAITSGVRNMQAVLDTAWELLLPICQPGPLPESPAKARALKEKLGELELPTAGGERSPALAAAVLGRTYALSENEQKWESISLAPAGEGGGIVFTVRSDGKEHRYPCGFGGWKTGRGPLGAFPDEPVAGSYGWSDADSLLVRLCAYETPFVSNLTLNFADGGNALSVESEANVAFGPTKRPTLRGTAR